MSGEEKDSGFLSRWSQRKIAAQDSRAEAMEAVAAEPPQPERDLTDEELLDKLELPDPETLKQGDDFSVFMNGAVPDRIRNRALRKLWLSNSALANLDELVDYGEDFTDAATVIENLKTVYEVGKGAAGRVLRELEEAKLKAQAEAAARATDPEPDEAGMAVAEKPAIEEAGPVPPAAPPSRRVEEGRDETARVRVRPMAFSFDKTADPLRKSPV